MQLFLDSAKTDEIAEAIGMWEIDGLTTNPRHIAASGKGRETVLREIADIVAGTELPVSVEVDPHLTDWRHMADAARRLAEISPNFVIKVGASEDGCRAVRALTRDNIRTNVTLVFSVAQAWQAARVGATYISPFIGWRETHGDDGLELIGDIVLMLNNYGYGSRVIAAAVRNSQHMAMAALAGAHCMTASFAAIRDSFDHPYTDHGHRVFGEAWNSTPEV